MPFDLWSWPSLFLETIPDNIFFWNRITRETFWYAMTTIQASSPAKIHFKYLIQEKFLWILAPFLSKWPWPLKNKGQGCNMFSYHFDVRYCDLGDYSNIFISKIVNINMAYQFLLRWPWPSKRLEKKISTTIFGIYLSRWTIWYITTLINKRKLRKHVFVTYANALHVQTVLLIHTCTPYICSLAGAKAQMPTWTRDLFIF